MVHRDISQQTTEVSRLKAAACRRAQQHVELGALVGVRVSVAFERAYQWQSTAGLPEART
jgi:hypothetical protein